VGFALSDEGIEAGPVGVGVRLCGHSQSRVSSCCRIGLRKKAPDTFAIGSNALEEKTDAHIRGAIEAGLLEAQVTSVSAVNDRFRRLKRRLEDAGFLLAIHSETGFDWAGVWCRINEFEGAISRREPTVIEAAGDHISLVIHDRLINKFIQSLGLADRTENAVELAEHVSDRVEELLGDPMDDVFSIGEGKGQVRLDSHVPVWVRTRQGCLSLVVEGEFRSSDQGVWQRRVVIIPLMFQENAEGDFVIQLHDHEKIESFSASGDTPAALVEAWEPSKLAFDLSPILRRVRIPRILASGSFVRFHLEDIIVQDEAVVMEISVHPGCDRSDADAESEDSCRNCFK